VTPRGSCWTLSAGSCGHSRGRATLMRRLAYGFNDEEQLIKQTTWSGVVVEERPVEMTYESGGEGFVVHSRCSR
jgi:hypothetical protein